MRLARAPPHTSRRRRRLDMRRRTVALRFLASTVIVTLVAGCGGGGAGADAGGGGGAGASSTGAGGSVNYLGYGVVTMFGTAKVDIDADFTTQAPDCAPQPLSAPCVAYFCTGKVSPKRVGAGGVTVTGNGTPWPLVEGADEHYQTMTATPLWTDAGGPLEVVATGAEAPAFDVKTTGPGRVVVSAPSFPTTALPLDVDITKDFELSWTGGGPGASVIAALEVEPPPGQPLEEIVCLFPVADGHGVIPASTFAGFHGRTGGLVIAATTTSTTVVNGWQILVSTQQDAKTTDGGSAQTTDVHFN
jgi:hypothetical protein